MVNFNNVSASFPSLPISCPEFKACYGKVAQCARDCLANLSFSSIKNSKWTYVVLAGVAALGVIYHFSKKIFKIQEEAGKEAASLNTEIAGVEDQLTEETKKIGDQQQDLERLQKELEQARLDVANLRGNEELIERVSEKSIDFKIAIKNQKLKALSEQVEILKNSLKKKEGNIAGSATPGSPTKSSEIDLQGIDKDKENLNELLRNKTFLEQEIDELLESLAKPGSLEAAQPLAETESLTEKLQALQGKNKALEQEIQRLKTEQVDQQASVNSEKAQVQSEIDSLKKKLEDGRSQITALQKEIDSLKAKKEPEALAATSDGVQSPVNEGNVEANVEALEKQIKELEGAKSSLEERLQRAPQEFIESCRAFFVAAVKLVKKGTPEQDPNTPASERKSAKKVGPEVVKLVLDGFASLPENIKTAIEAVAQEEKSQS